MEIGGYTFSPDVVINEPIRDRPEPESEIVPPAINLGMNVQFQIPDLPEKLNSIRVNIESIHPDRTSCAVAFLPILKILDILNPQYEIDEDFRNYLSNFLGYYFIRIMNFNSAVHGISDLCEMVDLEDDTLFRNVERVNKYGEIVSIATAPDAEDASSSTQYQVQSLGGCLQLWMNNDEIFRLSEDEKRAEVIANLQRLQLVDNEDGTAPSSAGMGRAELIELCSRHAREIINAYFDERGNSKTLMNRMLFLMRKIVDIAHLSQITKNNEVTRIASRDERVRIYREFREVAERTMRAFMDEYEDGDLRSNPKVSAIGRMGDLL